MLITAENYPDHDPWFYIAGIDDTAIERGSAYISNGTRTVHEVKIEGQLAYRKFDRNGRNVFGCDGLRDKVAGDLAQVLGVNVPATVLWSSEYDRGALQRTPPVQFHQTMFMFLSAVRTSKEYPEPLMAKLASAYDPMNLFFDVWMGNRDRRTNMSNLLIAETSSGLNFYLIDFDHSLSHREKPWFDEKYLESGFDADECPLPEFLLKNEEFLEIFDRRADTLNKRLQEVPDDLITEICARAGEYYGVGKASSLAETLDIGLRERRNLVMQWSRELLMA